MNTLGYTNEVVFSNTDIARIQLEEAIKQFISENFLCSLTLAGAAEEIFAGLLRVQNRDPAIEASYSAIEKMRENLKTDVMENKNKREVIREWNNAKNRLKHHDENKGDNITFNPCDEAYGMIKRALVNSSMFDITINNEKDFENWIIIHVCL